MVTVPIGELPGRGNARSASAARTARRSASGLAGRGRTLAAPSAAKGAAASGASKVPTTTIAGLPAAPHR
jgi:hypothetical protein